MKPAPLQLENYFVSELVFSANKDFVPGSPSEMQFGDLRVEPTCLNTEPRQWQVTLKVQFQPPADANYPYTFALEIVGFFKTIDGLKSDIEARLIKTNASSMLYGAAREIVRAATSRGPYVPVVLPSVSFYEPKPENPKASTPGEPAPQMKPRKKDST
jgi:preprotein translocase subunit SecB